MHDWADLWRAFVGNFQGTYKRPGSSWDYIFRLSKKGNELFDTTNADVVSAFTYITTNKPYYMSSNGGDQRQLPTSSTLRPSSLMGKTRWGQFSKSKKSHATSASPMVREGTDGSTPIDIGGIIAPHAPGKEKSLPRMGRSGHRQRTTMTISRS
jgi:hypothetical protein